ncbi:hypothetical protein ABW20_dc0104844 [Dactylellina cionopaga]|nr:hypothetical protein ABW20_dc0104844 [Dactylellina cionopaga]
MPLGVIYSSRNYSSEPERSTSPMRLENPLDMLKSTWGTTKRLATYSPSKTKYIGYDSSSPFLSVSTDAAGLKRSKTTGTHATSSGGVGLPTVVPLSSSNSLRKRFGLSTTTATSTDNGDAVSSTTSSANGGSVKESSGSLSKSAVKSMLRQRSNRNVKDKEKDNSLTTPTKVASLYRSQSTEGDIRRDYYERDHIPSRPMSRDSGPSSRPSSVLLASPGPTLVIPKNISANSNPLSPIVASPTATPTGAATADGSPLPSLRRKKRRSSLSDLVLVKDDQEAEETTETPPPEPVENSMSRKGSVDRKENFGLNVMAAEFNPFANMAPPPVPAHAKNGSIGSSTREPRGSIVAGLAAMYTDKVAPLNVSGVRMSRAYSDAGSIGSTGSRSSTTRESVSSIAPAAAERERKGSASGSSRTNGRLSSRLATEKTNVNKVSGALEQELALIAQELSRGGSRKGAGTPDLNISNSGTRAGVASTANNTTATDETLRRRMRLLESKLNNTVNDLNKRYETLRDDSHAALAKELQRNQEVERMWRDERNENDAVYKRFNEALEECVRGLKGRTDEDRVGLVRMLVQSQEEVAKLRGEVSALKKENVDLKYGKSTEL